MSRHGFESRVSLSPWLEQRLGEDAFGVNHRWLAGQITPVCPLRAFAKSNELWIKREDLLPFSFGGNKVRIALEFLGDMYRRSCDHMVVYGSPESNLLRAMSNLCAANGVPLTAIVPCEATEKEGDYLNLRLSCMLGAKVVRCERQGVRDAVEQVLAAIRDAGGKPYYVFGNSSGVGNEAVSALAYTKAYREILAQEQSLGVEFDIIAHASGTGMTQAGLMCGQALFGGSHQILGISIARSARVGIPPIERRIKALLDGCGCEVGKVISQIEFMDEFAQGGYAQSSDLVDSTIRQMMLQEGIPMDATYVGKAFAGLLSYLAQTGLEGRRVLFIHTGGTPLFFEHQGGWMPNDRR